MNFFIKQTDSETQKTNVWLQKGNKNGGGANQEFAFSRYKLLDKVLLYTQYPIKPNGKEYEKYIYTHN